MAEQPEPERIVGRYALFGEVAAGGMATVHLGRLIGPAGFARIVAVKRLHPQFAKDPEFVSMFLDEARLAARIRHPNVVSTLDVVALEGELFIVMDYVEGESLARLRRLAGDRGAPLSQDVSRAIFVNVLHGLHAAHETRGETGAPLGLIHRDVSPQNILVGVDGVARLVDFGVAKAAGRMQQTKTNVVKGKVGYMPPEQLQRGKLDRRTDVYAAAVVLWESLAGQRLFDGANDFQVAEQIIHRGVQQPPSYFNSQVSAALDAVVMRGLQADPARRYATALDMADALEQSGALASARSIGQLVQALAADSLAARASRVHSIEGATPIGTSSVVAATLARPRNATVPAPMPVAEPTQAFAGPTHVLRPDSSAPAAPVAPSDTTRALPVQFAPAALQVPSDTVEAAPEPKAERNPHRAALIGVGVAFAVAFGVGLTLLVVRGALGTAEAPSPPPALEPGESDVPPASSQLRPSPEPAASLHLPDPAPEASLPKEQAVATASAKGLAIPPPVPAPRPPNRCNPPHYFDGPIKKLKPGCY